MSIRVSQFEAYLDFLNNYYQFSCDFLTMGRIKRILALVNVLQFLPIHRDEHAAQYEGPRRDRRHGQEGNGPALFRPHNDSVAQLDKAAGTSSPASRPDRVS
jgi:hypothetical protein